MARTVTNKSPAKGAKPANPTTPLRRSLRSSSRKRESSPSEQDDEEEEEIEIQVKTTRRKSVTRARSTSKSRKNAESPAPNEKKAISKSPSRGKAAVADSPKKRSTRSSSRKRVNNDDDEVEQPASRKSLAKNAKNAKQIPAKPTSRRSSRSRVSREDSEEELEDEEEEEQEEEEVEKPIPKGKKTPTKIAEKQIRSKSPSRRASTKATTSAGADEKSTPKHKKIPVRTRSRSRGRAQADSDEESETVVQAPISPRQRRTRGQQLQSPMNEVFGSDESANTATHAKKQAVVLVKPIDAIYLLAIFIFPLILSLFNLWNISPSIRNAIIAKCSILNKLTTFSFSTPLQLFTNFMFLLFTLVLIAYKLRRSDTAPSITSRITSMVFRGYVALTLLLTWVVVYQYQIASIDTLKVLALTLLPFAIVEALYTYYFQTFARWVEQVFIFGIASFILFKLPTTVQPVEQLLIETIAPPIVVYLLLNLILSIGYVGVLSTSNTTHSSLLVTSISHAFIWIHLVLTIAGPLFILYFEMLKDLTVLNNRVHVITKAIGIAISVILHFANYADSMAIENLQISDKSD